MKFIGWSLALLLGTGWFFSWMSEWDESDKKANLILEIIFDAHKFRFSDDELDRFFTFRRVMQKEKLIKDFVEKEHPYEPLSLFSEAEKSIYDSNAWRSSIDSYLKSEERIHPDSYKKVTMKVEWGEFRRNNYYANYLQKNENIISESVLVSLSLSPSSSRVFDINSKKTVSGILTSKKPRKLINIGYPVVELNVKKVPNIDKADMSKLQANQPSLNSLAIKEIINKLDRAGIDINKGQPAFFIPSYQEIPNSYFGTITVEEKVNALEKSK